MSGAKHTPAPWAVHPRVAVVDAGPIRANGLLTPVCQLLWPTDARTEAETEANAHLIAAAPDLFEALEVLVQLDAADVFTKDAWFDAFKAARAALAKARGAA